MLALYKTISFNHPSDAVSALRIMDHAFAFLV